MYKRLYFYTSRFSSQVSALQVLCTYEDSQRHRQDVRIHAGACGWEVDWVFWWIQFGLVLMMTLG